jgi:hypothetical protein
MVEYLHEVEKQALLFYLAFGICDEVITSSAPPRIIVATYVFVFFGFGCFAEKVWEESVEDDAREAAPSGMRKLNSTSEISMDPAI